MREWLCRFLLGISIGLIIALIVALLFFFGLLPNIIIAIIFSIVLALLSLLILSILGSSDNGLSRSYLNKSISFTLFSIIRKYIFWIISISCYAYKRKHCISDISWTFNIFLDIKFV